MQVLMSIGGSSLMLSAGLLSFVFPTDNFNMVWLTAWIFVRQFAQDSIPFQFIYRYRVLKM